MRPLPQQPNPKIVSKLGSTDDLKMMANTVALEASNAVAYDDATRTSSFYSTYYTFPTGSSVKSPSGWDITGHPTLTLASTFTQHQVQAKDTAAKTPTTSLSFDFACHSVHISNGGCGLNPLFRGIIPQ